MGDEKELRERYPDTHTIRVHHWTQGYKVGLLMTDELRDEQDEGSKISVKRIKVEMLKVI